MARAESLDLSAYPSVLADMVNSLVDGYNDIMLLTNTIDAYLYSFNSTDSFNTEANRKMSEFEMQTVAVRKINTRLRS